MIPLNFAPRCLIIARVLRMMNFLLPIMVLFYQDKGATIGDVFLIQGAWAISVFFLEIPSGYLGDLCSRKTMVTLSFLVCAGANFLMGFGYGFWVLLCGELLLGFSHALYSGTAEAYYHDLLKKRSKEGKLHKKLAKLETFSMTGLAVATVLAGFVYSWLGANACAYLTGILSLVAFGIVCFLPNIKESKRVVADNISKFKDLMNISKFTMKHPEIKWLILFPACYGALTFVLLWGMQPMMVDKEVPVYLFGFIAGFNMFCRTGWAYLSGVLLDKIKLRKTARVLFYTLCIGAISACVIMSAHNMVLVYALLALIAIANASQMAVEIITSNFVHHRIKSDERSTILSVKSMISMFASGTLMILIKPLIDVFGIQMTFILCGLLVIPTFVAMMHLLKLRIKE
ncbi:MAG: MFS transporter [Alphaproteobacteria bacterium]|nr:MFS transporter [Alphaproteobacteria bacterium]